MLLGKKFESFVQASPVSVMVRGVLERAFAPAHLDALFERTAQVGYTRELLFSATVQLMSEVVLGVSPSVHAAYQDAAEALPVTITAVYDKLQGIETAVSAALVRDSAQQFAPLVQALAGQARTLLAGYQVRILDGNHLAGVQHRLAELRRLRAAGLPGLSLVVLDPQLMLMMDVILEPDGHTQERSLLSRILPLIQPGELWIGDRNFCTLGFLFGVVRREGCLLVRQHGLLQGVLLGKRKSRGRTDTGRLYEQTMRLEDPQTGQSLQVRRITVDLDEPTREGETQIHLLTNLPVGDANARQVAELYLRRWTIEQAFQDLTVALVCELNTLGYPKAALFGFCLALVAYNAVSLVQAALRAVHGAERIEQEVSWYHLCLHLAKVYSGMMIAIPTKHWAVFRELDNESLAQLLIDLAGRIDLRRFRKHPRGPKKPRPVRQRAKHNTHVSIARLLAARPP